MSNCNIPVKQVVPKVRTVLQLFCLPTTIRMLLESVLNILRAANNRRKGSTTYKFIVFRALRYVGSPELEKLARVDLQKRIDLLRSMDNHFVKSGDFG